VLFYIWFFYSISVPENCDVSWYLKTLSTGPTGTDVKQYLASSPVDETLNIHCAIKGAM